MPPVTSDDTGAGGGTADHQVALAVIAREWLRIGIIGFGGPPAHIVTVPRALCRRAAVAQRRGLRARHRRHQPAPGTGLDPARHLLRLAPPPHRRRGAGRPVLHRARPGADPGPLGAVLLGQPSGMGAGRGGRGRGGGGRGGPRRGDPSHGAELAEGRHLAGAPDPMGGVPGARRGGRGDRRPVSRPGPPGLRAGRDGRAAGGPARRRRSAPSRPGLLAAAVPAAGGLGALAWVAFKVGALSYGGGFVIMPLMQADAVSHYHWMTSAQFLNARGPRPADSGPGRPDRGRRGLRGRGPGRRAAGRRGGLRPLLRLRPGRGSALRPAADQPDGPGLPGRGRPGRHRRHRRGRRPPRRSP